MKSNFALERTAGSRALAAAAHRNVRLQRGLIMDTSALLAIARETIDKVPFCFEQRGVLLLVHSDHY